MYNKSKKARARSRYGIASERNQYSCSERPTNIDIPIKVDPDSINDIKGILKKYFNHTEPDSKSDYVAECGYVKSERPLAELELSVRVYTALQRYGVDTVETLMSMTEDELNRIRGIDYIGIKEIKRKLNMFGFSLASEQESKEPEQITMGMATPDWIGKNHQPNKIEDLDLPRAIIRKLRHAGLTRIDDLCSKTCSELLSLPYLQEKDIDLIISELGDWGLSLRESARDVEAEKTHPGREKCDQLRKIRKLIAEANDIAFEPAECHHTGPCKGTCPVCDAEIKYLDEQIQKKRARGEQVYLTGLSGDESLSPSRESIGDEVITNMAGFAKIPDGIDEEMPFK